MLHGHGGQGGIAEGLGPQQKLLHKEVILQVRLVGRGAGLTQELSGETVELDEGHGIPLADQAGDVACLRLGLVRGVTVQIEAVAVGAGIVGTAVRVLIGHDNDDQVVQNLVHAHLLILAERVVLAGIGAAVVSIAVDGGSADFQSVAGEGGLGAAVIALQREVHDLGIVHPHVHLFAAGQTGDGVPGHRVLGGQGAQQVGVGIYAAGLIGVAVVLMMGMR